MKASVYFSKLMLIATAALTMGSCSSSMDIPFEITNPIFGYAIQTQSGGTNYFTPVFNFSTISSSSKIVSGDVLKGSISLGGDVYLDVLFESFSSANRVTDLTALNGPYTMKATDDKSKTATFSYDMSFVTDDVMNLGAGVSELDVEDFAYSNQTITAKIAAVGNATDYAFFMVPVLEGAPDNGSEIKTLLWCSTSYLFPKTSDGRQTVTAGFVPVYYDYWIYPAAVRSTDTGVLLIFGKGKLLRLGASSF